MTPSITRHNNNNISIYSSNQIKLYMVVLNNNNLLDSISNKKLTQKSIGIKILLRQLGGRANKIWMGLEVSHLKRKQEGRCNNRDVYTQAWQINPLILHRWAIKTTFMRRQGGSRHPSNNSSSRLSLIQGVCLNSLKKNNFRSLILIRDQSLRQG